jgi:NAD kinase
MDTRSQRKVIVVTRRTRYEDLLVRFQTREQARFYVEHLGANFDDYEAEHVAYQRARRQVRDVLEGEYRHQFIERQYLANFLFGADHVVIALGQDGLVANTLKYLQGHPLIGINPEPTRFDGVLLPFVASELRVLLPEVLADRRPLREVAMARVDLQDGQVLHAVNDLFVGPNSHTSLRYEIEMRGRRELQSSSGIVVSTGLGSTGWLQSIVTGSAAIARQVTGARGGAAHKPFDWARRELVYAVREPFPSHVTGTSIVCGRLGEGDVLTIRSMAAGNGVIFSDGMESDYLAFNSGTLAAIRISDRRGRLVH